MFRKVEMKQNMEQMIKGGMLGAASDLNIDKDNSAVVDHSIQPGGPAAPHLSVGSNGKPNRKRKKKDEVMPTRRSKRLRGMSPASAEPVEFTPKKSVVEDVLKSSQFTAVSPEASNIFSVEQPEMSTQSTIPDEEDQVDTSVQGPARLPHDPPAILLTPSEESSDAPPGLVPTVLHGRRFLRISYRKFCFEAPAGKPKWQSEYFFQRITDNVPRTDFREALARDNYILIPDDLLGPYDPSQVDFLAVFFDHFSASKLPTPSIVYFFNPPSMFFDIRRLRWWKLVAEHFHVPHYLEIVYEFLSPGIWHMVFHGARTFESIRELFEIIEALSLWRSVGIIHLELARRMAFMECFGKVKSVTLLNLLKLGGKEIRERSRKYDYAEEFEGRSVLEICTMCTVQPPFGGLRMQC